MTNQPMPDLSVDERLVGNLRRSRLEMEEIGLQLEEVIARFDQENRQYRARRVQQSLTSTSKDISV